MAKTPRTIRSSAINKAKQHYYHSKVAEVDSTNPSKWWRQVKSLLLGKISNRSGIIGFLVKVGTLKHWQIRLIIFFFVSLTEHFSPLTQARPPNFVPQELFVSRDEVYRSLSMLNTAKAVRPDNIPNKLLRDFALELATVIQNIYNQTLEKGHIPAP